jgi:hypothetical protein
MLAIEIATLGFAWWLGLYLLRRSEAVAAARWTGGGLISYALAQERAALRELTDALPRTRALDPEWGDEEFVKLTRKALSHLGDLPKLASSPLIRLPLIDKRLRQNGLEDNTLARTAELKALLVESIGRLKPSDSLDFDTSQAWRHFNALHFPYVRGFGPTAGATVTTTLAPPTRKRWTIFRLRSRPAPSTIGKRLRPG